MKRCDPRAFSKCPCREFCGDASEAVFADGSECDKFNEQALAHPMTNAERIRAMSNEELAAFITTPFCESISNCKCREHAFSGGCYVCAKDWLQQPAEEEA